ncbi:MAG: hypothetical protein M3Z23_11105 [Acidobacteriota bacterium]|nr:hypothetical protein [Acidobacteriota bacterium]
MHIRNAETRFVNEANNVHATIEYEDELHTDRYVVRDAVWRPENQGISPGLHGSISLEGGQDDNLIVLCQGPDGKWLTALDPDSRAKELKPGHWKVRVKFSADNCGDLKLIGGFTIHRDNRFEPDKPAFGIMRPLQRLSWSGK